MISIERDLIPFCEKTYKGATLRSYRSSLRLIAKSGTPADNVDVILAEKDARTKMMLDSGRQVLTVVGYWANLSAILKRYNRAKQSSFGPPLVIEAKHESPGLREQIDDALKTLPQWPALQRFLLPGILEAVKSLE